MRKILSLLLALVIVASLTVVAVSAAGADAADTAVGTATVTFTNIKGESITQTYAVGETFTAYTYLNASQVNSGKMGSLNGSQEYSSDILEVADSFVTDEEEYDFGMIDDVDTLYPIISDSVIANAGHPGEIYYNASKASLSGYVFNSDTCLLMMAHYTVKAAGEATITNKMQTLAASDSKLTRLVDKGSIVNTNFTSPIALSEPETPVQTGYTVSGSLTSYLSTTEVITVDIVKDGAVVNTTSGAGITTYSISNVEAGSYILRVSKKNHVTRDYEITVSGDTTQNVKICPKGDVSGDGKVTSKDSSMAFQKAQTKIELNDYQIKCGDVVRNDGKVTSNDASRIFQHATGKSSLWT